MANIAYNRMNPYNPRAMFDKHIYPHIENYFKNVLGYNQVENTKKSIDTQISYEQYIKAGNERALADWHRNVPGRSIKYPEFSYPGSIRRADTSIATAGFSYDNAIANYEGGLANRALGLYSVPGRLYRNL